MAIFPAARLLTGSVVRAYQRRAVRAVSPALLRPCPAHLWQDWFSMRGAKPFFDETDVGGDV